MSERSIAKAVRQALEGPIARRSFFVAVIVGSLLNLINQGDRLVDGQKLDWLKIALTFCVPFCVATYGAATAIHQASRRLDQ